MEILNDEDIQRLEIHSEGVEAVQKKSVEYAVKFASDALNYFRKPNFLSKNTMLESMAKLQISLETLTMSIEGAEVSLQRYQDTIRERMRKKHIVPPKKRW